MISRKLFVILSLIISSAIFLLAQFWLDAYWLFVIILPLIILGVYDIVQRTHTILRLYPVIGHLRYLFELIRPEIQQYFVESNTNGKPVSREFRALVYQRAKGQRDTRPFGTQFDVYRNGYEWINHSLAPKAVQNQNPRIRFGSSKCTKPYNASPLNISAMSFGALSKNAIMALNKGAKIGGFAHNTGEGGISPYHLKFGGDLIWQIGTGYFGCRSVNGDFDEALFTETARQDIVKMIEIKLSQGAKPGHGGILPAVGCIQSLHCNQDRCPTGIATQNPSRYKALDVDIKSVRVANYHTSMIENLMELVAAAGLNSLDELRPWHINRRVHGTETRHYGELYPSIADQCLLSNTEIPETWRNDWNQATSGSW